MLRLQPTPMLYCGSDLGLLLLTAVTGLGGCSGGAPEASAPAPSPVTTSNPSGTGPSGGSARLVVPSSTIPLAAKSERELLGRWIVDRSATTEPFYGAETLVFSGSGRIRVESGGVIDRGSWRIEPDGTLRISGVGDATTNYTMVLETGMLALSSAPKTMVVLRQERLLAPAKLPTGPTGPNSSPADG